MTCYTCHTCHDTGYYELRVIAHREVVVSSTETCHWCDAAAEHLALKELKALTRKWQNRAAYE